MTSHTEGARDRLGHRHDVTSLSGYVVLRRPLGLPCWRVPLRYYDESVSPLEGQTSVVTKNTVEAGGISRQHEWREY